MAISKLPSVLAFEKKLVPSDAFMYGTTWGKLSEFSKLLIREKSVRGTISHRLKKSDLENLNAKIENPNLQTVDSCSLGQRQDTLKVCFTLKVLSGVENPSACNQPEFISQYQEVAENYIARYGFRELANRYTTNIANARFLWRNRVGAEKLHVKVNILNQESANGSVTNFEFDSKIIHLRNFDQNVSSELTNIVARALSGEIEFAILDITAYAKLGEAQEVYPSEELVLPSSRSSRNVKSRSRINKKSKILYSVNEQAALHSQKIGNALRCIDTWYPEPSANFNIHSLGPIAIDPYGAVTNMGIAFRNPSLDGQDFYSLFQQYVESGELDDEDQEHFVMAVLVRGGVFGEKSE